MSLLIGLLVLLGLVVLVALPLISVRAELRRILEKVDAAVDRKVIASAS